MACSLTWHTQIRRRRWNGYKLTYLRLNTLITHAILSTTIAQNIILIARPIRYNREELLKYSQNKLWVGNRKVINKYPKMPSVLLIWAKFFNSSIHSIMLLFKKNKTTDSSFSTGCSYSFTKRVVQLPELLINCTIYTPLDSAPAGIVYLLMPFCAGKPDW